MSLVSPTAVGESSRRERRHKIFAGKILVPVLKTDSHRILNEVCESIASVLRLAPVHFRRPLPSNSELLHTL